MANDIKVKIYISPEQTIKTNVITGGRGPIGPTGPTGALGPTGPLGPTGETGLGFKIAKTYPTVASLLADTNPTGILVGEFAAIITVDPENVDNGKLYL